MNHLELTKLLTQTLDPTEPAVLERHLSAIAAETLAAGLTGRGAAVRILDAAAVTNKGDLLGQLAWAFDFPGYFGNNWDAALDCLSDFSWLPARAYVCILVNAQELQRSQPVLQARLVQTWEEAALRWKSRPGNIVARLILAKSQPGA